MGQSDKTPSTSLFPWKEILLFLGVLLTAYIGYLGNRSQVEIPIQTTQSAEARLTEFANFSISTPTFIIVTETPVSISTPAIQTNIPSNTSLPTNLPETSEKTIMQVSPYWGWNNELSTKTLMLNILWKGDCKNGLEIIVDDESFFAQMIDDPNDVLYLKDKALFEGTTGTSCNYRVSNTKAVQPFRFFSVPSATYGRNLPMQEPYEWCYQKSEKTWYPCQ